MVQCIVVRQNNGNLKKPFMSESEWLLCLGQKRCFAGGVLESRSNRHIGSVQWDKKLLRRVVQKKWRGHLTWGVLLWHDNLRPHTAVRTVLLWQLFDITPYSLDLATSGPSLTPPRQSFPSIAEFRWRRGAEFGGGTLAADFCDEGIQQVVPPTINTSIPIATV